MKFEPQVFSIPAPNIVGLWPALLLPLLTSLVLLGVMVALVSGGLRCAVRDDGLELRGAGYGRLIAWKDVFTGSARVTDFASEPDLRPSIRTHGIGLPGYSVGWFRLRGGKRALVFLTHAPRFVAVDTNAGYLLLVGADEPEALVAAIREH